MIDKISQDFVPRCRPFNLYIQKCRDFSYVSSNWVSYVTITEVQVDICISAHCPEGIVDVMRKGQVFCTFLLKLNKEDWSNYKCPSTRVLLILRIQY